MEMRNKSESVQEMRDSVSVPKCERPLPDRADGKRPVLVKYCGICGKRFEVSGRQSTQKYCSDACKRRAKALAQKKKSAGVPPEGSHLCVACRTSQAECEFFKSRFQQYPEGAEVRVQNGEKAVVRCPKFK